MNENTERSAHNLLSSLNDTKSEEAVKDVVARRDTKEAIRDELFSFLRGHMNRINESERLRAAIQEKLLAQVERDELTYDQLIALFTKINNHLRDHSDSIMAILKPVPGAASPLSETISHHSDSDMDRYEEIFANASPEALRALDGVMRMLNRNRDEKKVNKDYDYDDLPDSINEQSDAD